MRGITTRGPYGVAIAADRFSLLALRSRGLALWLGALGLFALATGYIFPVAATLQSTGDTISALQQLTVTNFVFPALKIPAVTRAGQLPPLTSAGALLPSAGPSTQSRAATSMRLPVVTNKYVTQALPANPAKADPNLPT